jgi:hypothetical protein
MSESDKNSPAYHNGAHDAMEGAWDLMEHVCAGTIAVRQQGRVYLPMEPAEDVREYEQRLRRALFFNATERTLNALVGMVFRKEPKLSADVLPPVVALWENIDNAGTHGAVFAKEAFASAMKYGHGLIYVDMPPPLPPGSTLADERAVNRRPYWVFYEADQIINWRYETVNGQSVLTLLVLEEETTEPDGEYGGSEVCRYRVLRPGSWQIYREYKSISGKIEYLLEAEGTTILPMIPVAPIYTRRTGNLTSKPFLLDLALLNLTHYQKYSDYSTYLHIASRPVLWFRGRNQAKALEPIGPYTFFDVDQEGGHVAFAETTGAALGAARTDLEDLKTQMAILGLSLLAGPSPQPTTATEQMISRVQSDSDLATAARSLKDALEQCFYLTALYLGLDSGGSIELESMSDGLFLQPADLQAYSAMVANGQLSLETMWAVLERAGRLPEDFDAEIEAQRISERQTNLGDALLTAFDKGQ